MGDYSVQFGTEDVVRVYTELSLLEERVKKERLGYLTHELRTNLSSVIANSAIVFSEVPQLGPLPMVSQRDDVANFFDLAQLVNKGILALSSAVSSQSSAEIGETAPNLVKNLTDLSNVLPVEKRVLELGEITGSRLKALKRIDPNSVHVFYAFNLVFSPEYRREVFDLSEDVKNYWVSTYPDPLDQEAIHMIRLKLDRVRTSQNYFARVVFPLITNIYQHAFNPENDLEGRSTSPFNRKFEIDAVSPKTLPGEITVIVKDNGFGIKPEIYDCLFKRGVSSKPKSEQEHGIGLWAVKEFVESNGGTISCETVLGQGTSFSFTIPVVREEQHTYYGPGVK